jgi:hypothetical protein
MPFGVRGGARLITIGTLGTAVTADCTLHVDMPPECENDAMPPVFTHVPRAVRVDPVTCIPAAYFAFEDDSVCQWCRDEGPVPPGEVAGRAPDGSCVWP